MTVAGQLLDQGGDEVTAGRGPPHQMGVVQDQRHVPTGESAFSWTAWVSSVVLPNPAAATTAVSGRSKRERRRPRRRGRRIRSRPAKGGAYLSARLMR